MAHIDGNTFANELFGTRYSDTIHPGRGNDTVHGYGGNDRIDDAGHGSTGSGGNDTFYGGDDVDTGESAAGILPGA
ncbi:calcium-binding protein, partial [Cereibacter sphaeroides]|nr:calcium-binding protein [Cereibacter sphaeroides]